ncbi:diaminopimelate epimerase [Methanogenium sp. MK-MG]|uniref:diaminopimelate epimerase n=1 Tax=Methanogenium sp. MK-MG TaxID=2599926 RepID=UPI0013EC0C1E|nr:diaminopimelate epimerase [Methanogenium sp. MK-MG]KAF1078240.1 Diaminopimelate epimerase [Methanogenium sp. MK-MG]
MEIPFVKLQGNGNDFVLIDEMGGSVIPDEMKGEFARLYCDRRFGIGADGIIFMSPSESCDVRMCLFQPDESEAEMCGNGIRCLAKYAYDSDYTGEECTVETQAGVMAVTMAYNDAGEFTATIDMGPAKFTSAEIPATGEGEFSMDYDGFTVYAANTGVPHAVVFVDDVAAVNINEVAPGIRSHPVFPEGANVNFVQCNTTDSITIRTFERGVEAETYSCGTGSTAAAAVAHHLGKVPATVHVQTRGGPLTIKINETVTMEGPAVTVFGGIIPL